MDEREFEDMLRRVLGQDFSAGTEEFRDALLARCLAELNADGAIVELADTDLGLLAAAGDAASLDANRLQADDGTAPSSRTGP